MRKLFLALLVLCFLGLAGYGGYRGYLAWRQIRLVKQARAFLAKSDTRRASLSLQRALRANPRDVDACRLMAELNDEARSPGALLWRSRVVDLNPGSLDDRLALARTALLLRELSLATNAIEGIREPDRRTPGYHNIAGAVASAANQISVAEFHFREASRLEPTNPVPQLNLAVIRLQSTNEAVRAQAAAALNQLRNNPAVKSQALRELTTDALRRKQSGSALALSRELVQLTNSVFRDRLLRLDVLRRAQHPDFKPTLGAFQREATNSAATIYELTLWQIANSLPREALTWLTSLPPAAQTNQPVNLLSAECRVALQDWDGLLASLEPQNWAELDFLRSTFMARANRGRDQTAAAKMDWERVVKAVGVRRESLIMLFRIAAQWGWRTEAEGVLWTIVNRFPGEQWASRALTEILYSEGRTRSLMTLYGSQLKAAPTDLALMNNLATAALLLGANEQRPHELARQVYERASTNAFYASTYAFSLHLQDKNPEALKTMERLGPKDLENPAIAGYYGLILRATGNAAKARPYLEVASKTRLLPEERRLLEQASR